jgi:hypothetical protein
MGGLYDFRKEEFITTLSDDFVDLIHNEMRLELCIGEDVDLYATMEDRITEPIQDMETVDLIVHSHPVSVPRESLCLHKIMDAIVQHAPSDHTLHAVVRTHNPYVIYCYFTQNPPSPDLEEYDPYHW